MQRILRKQRSLSLQPIDTGYGGFHDLNTDSEADFYYSLQAFTQCSVVKQLSSSNFRKSNGNPMKHLIGYRTASPQYSFSTSLHLKLFSLCCYTLKGGGENTSTLAALWPEGAVSQGWQMPPSTPTSKSSLAYSLINALPNM